MQPHFKTVSTGHSVWWWLAIGAMLVGIALRLWQWLLGTTFFIDELAVLHNLTTRSLSQLVGVPLNEAQVAPPLFLLAEKACLVVLGRSELALRLPALLASLVSLVLFRFIARRVLDEPLVPLALLTFAVGFTFVYYSNQVKQYAGDVAVTLMVLRLALGLRDAVLSQRLVWLAVLAGMVLPFYSQASLMAFAGCGAALLLLAYFDAGRPRWGATVAVVGAWAVGCVVSLALAQRTLTPIDRAYMHFFWRDGLLPFDAHLPITLASEMAERWANGLGWPHPASLWVVGSLVGIMLLWRQQREAALLLLAPWLVSIIASLLQQFPLRMRLMDFLVPTMILFLFVAFQAIVRWLWALNHNLGVAVLTLGVLPILYSMTRHNLPPYCAEDTKSLLAQLTQARVAGDRMYVYYGAGQALRWYGPQYGFSPANYRLGHCYHHLPEAERHYLAEVDAFRGQRVWVVMEHFDDYEAQVLTAYLDGIGRRGRRITVARQLPNEAVGFPILYAQYYDLSDTTRAARFTAANFPLPPAPLRPADEICWSCYGPQVISSSRQ